MQWSDLLEPLDWSRQAATNAGEGLYGLASGDFTRDNFAKTIPAIAGLGAGLLTGGTMAPLAGAGVAAMTQGIGKLFNPKAMQAMSTNDLVEKLGGDRDSTWQNMGMHLATDPLTYAGLGMMGRGVKGAAGAAAGAADAGGELAASGGSRLGSGMLASMKTPGAGGLRASMGLVAPEEATASGVSSSGSGGRLADMLKARRDISKVAYNPETGQVAGGAGRALTGGELEKLGQQLPGQWAKGSSGMTGSFGGNPLMVLTGEASPAVARGTARHELYHALTRRSADFGDSLGIGPYQRATAKLLDTAAPGGSREALATLMDEAGAHAAGAGTSPLSKAMGGADFLFGLPNSGVNRAYYANQLRKMSPMVGGLYDAMGVAPKAAALGAVGAGTYYGANRLLRE